MAHKFWIPKTLYDEMQKAAKAKGLSVQEYADQLFEAILLWNGKIVTKKA